MLKILALGNSFSTDCTTYLDRVGKNLYVRNLYIGGCSLERHAKNLLEDLPYYQLQVQGEPIQEELVSAAALFCADEWDFITVQQASGVSGLQESFDPHLDVVLDYIRRLCPRAKILWHQTWAYATYSTHPEFVNYGKDQAQMWKQIEACSHRTVREKQLDGIIETGRAIQALREQLTPDGTELCRDGFHLSLDYGRYAGAYVWAKKFGTECTGFVPDGADEARVAQIRRIIDNVYK